MTNRGIFCHLDIALRSQIKKDKRVGKEQSINLTEAATALELL